MTYNGLNPLVRNSDAFGRPVTLDAFGRARASMLTTLFASKQTFDNNPLLYDISTSGTGFSLYVQSVAATNLGAGNGGAGTATRQSHLRQNYQPGKSQLSFITYHMTDFLTASANARGQVGFFDALNGMFLRVNGGVPASLSLVLRNVGVDTVVAQGAWNIDTLDGSGNASNPSGKQLNVQNVSNILYVAFEALMVGTVEMGWVIDGVLTPAHLFSFSNGGGSGIVYSQSPNLPVRWEVEAFADLGGFAAVMYAICASMNSEGGEDPVGNFRVASRPVTAGKTINSNIREQVLAIRLGTGPGIQGYEPVAATSFSLITTSSSNFLWEIVRNPTVGGAAVWTPVASSPVEFDANLTAAGTRIVTAGTVVFSGYTGVSGSGGLTLQGLQSLLTRLGTDPFTGARDVLALVATPVGANEVFNGTMGWFEYA
jgi:hypothetical protein